MLNDLWIHTGSQKTQGTGKMQRKGSYLQTGGMWQGNAVFLCSECVHVFLVCLGDRTDSLIKGSEGVTTETPVQTVRLDS